MKPRLPEIIPPPHYSKASEPEPKSETSSFSIEKYKNKLILDVEQDVILEKPKVSFPDIVGQEQAKRALQDHIILPVRYPQLFVGSRHPSSGLWLYGPRGTGKTLLIQACANELDAPLFVLEAQDLLMRGPEKAIEKVKKTVAAAIAAVSSLIYLDDVVSLISETPTRKLSQAWKSFRNEYLIEFNCYSLSLRAPHVMVLATSQKPWLLDAYPRRKIFQRRIYIPLPDESARKELLKKLLNPSGYTPLPLEDQEYLVKQTNRFSVTEIQEFVRQACYEPIREAQRSKAFKVYGELPDGAPIYQACDESDLEAKKMSLLDIPAEQLKLREISRGDFERVWSQILPHTDELDIFRYEDFISDFEQA